MTPTPNTRRARCDTSFSRASPGEAPTAEPLRLAVRRGMESAHVTGARNARGTGYDPAHCEHDQDGHCNAGGGVSGGGHLGVVVRRAPHWLYSFCLGERFEVILPYVLMLIGIFIGCLGYALGSMRVSCV